MKSLISILSILLIFMIGACAGPRGPMTPQQEADMLYAKASQLKDGELYDESNIQFEEYAKKFPESKRADNAKLQIADTNFQQGKYDQAIAVYQEIIDQYPESDTSDHALLSIGDAYFVQQKYDESTEAYKKLIQKYPRFGTDVALKARDKIRAIEDIKTDAKILAEGKDEDKDNAQYEIGDIYFSIFGYYDRARDEFQKVVDRWPKSEMADNALWKTGECYWSISAQQIPPAGFSKEHIAYIALIGYYDKFPQLTRIREFRLDVHWPTHEDSSEYRVAYMQVRQIVSKYPDILDKKVIDFLPEDYRKAFEKWQEILYTYSHTDKAVDVPMRVAQGFVDLGNLYYNLGEKHFAGILFKESLMARPTPEGHLGMARYYGNITAISAPSWAYRRAFFHIKEAEKLTPPDSPMADKVSWAKEWMNYKMRIEGLETWSERKTKR
jgi:outer membrane assembly lipoprotein YfiO